MASSSQALSLYRDLLRTSGRFSDYNFRMLAKRRVMEKFRESRNETDPAALEELFAKAAESKQMLVRQTTIGEMFRWSPVTIDKRRS